MLRVEGAVFTQSLTSLGRAVVVPYSFHFGNNGLIGTKFKVWDFFWIDTFQELCSKLVFDSWMVFMVSQTTHLPPTTFYIFGSHNISLNNFN